MHAHYQKSVSQEWIWVLSLNFQRILKGEHRLTKMQYVHATTNITATTTIAFTTTAASTTTSTLQIVTKIKLPLHQNKKTVNRTIRTFFNKTVEFRSSNEYFGSVFKSRLQHNANENIRIQKRNLP